MTDFRVTLRGSKSGYAKSMPGFELVSYTQQDVYKRQNPQNYPIPTIDPLCWHRLPEEADGLEAAAAAYYGNDRLLLLPGSQAAIQILAALFKPAVVACLAPIYEEHPQAWQRAGHQLRRLPTLQRALAAATPIVLLCNPSNPTATTLPREALLEACLLYTSRCV